LTAFRVAGALPVPLSGVFVFHHRWESGVLRHTRDLTRNGETVRFTKSEFPLVRLLILERFVARANALFADVTKDAFRKRIECLRPKCQALGFEIVNLDDEEYEAHDLLNPHDNGTLGTQTAHAIAA
jgi:hypothetical protein